MTYKEYITKTLNRFYVSPDDIEILMLNQAIDSEADVDVHAAKMAVYKEFSSILPVANMSEGGSSVTWITENVLAWYSLLASELSMPDVMNDNTVKDLSAYW